MREEPNIVAIAALIGDPVRAQLLMALMDGRALTATELARVGGVTKQTASSHLRRLCEARLLAVEAQGRHRYFRLGDRVVAQMLEQLSSLSTRLGAPSPQRCGPRDPALRHARVCYDHLAGDLGVEMFEQLAPRYFVEPQHGLRPNARGVRFFGDFGIDVEALAAQKRALCRTCLDWSARRHHLAGSLGAALLDRFFALGWARRARQSRAVLFTADGERALRDLLRSGRK